MSFIFKQSIVDKFLNKYQNYRKRKKGIPDLNNKLINNQYKKRKTPLERSNTNVKNIPIIAEILEGITDITAQLKRLLEEYSFVKTDEGVND